MLSLFEGGIVAARAKTGSFATEVELSPVGKRVKKMRACFEAAHHVYDNGLGKALHQLNLMRHSHDWQNAKRRTLPHIGRAMSHTKIRCESSWGSNTVPSRRGPGSGEVKGEDAQDTGGPAAEIGPH